MFPPLWLRVRTVFTLNRMNHSSSLSPVCVGTEITWKIRWRLAGICALCWVWELKHEAHSYATRRKQPDSRRSSIGEKKVSVTKNDRDQSTESLVHFCLQLTLAISVKTDLCPTQASWISPVSLILLLALLGLSLLGTGTISYSVFHSLLASDYIVEKKQVALFQLLTDLVLRGHCPLKPCFRQQLGRLTHSLLMSE